MDPAYFLPAQYHQTHGQQHHQPQGPSSYHSSPPSSGSGSGSGSGSSSNSLSPGETHIYHQQQVSNTPIQQYNQHQQHLQQQHQQQQRHHHHQQQQQQQQQHQQQQQRQLLQQHQQQQAQVTEGYVPPPTTGPMIAPHQDLQSFLESFWTRQMDTVEGETPDWKSYNLPLARIKKVMKSDEDVKMISAEAPIMFSKACEIFISELTCRAWLVAESNKRRTLQKSDVAAAIAFSDMFDFLIDIIPRDDGSGAAAVGAGQAGTAEEREGEGSGGAGNGSVHHDQEQDQEQDDENDDGVDVEVEGEGYNDQGEGGLYSEFVQGD